MLSDAIMFASGLVLLIAGLVVLTTAARGELSHRSVSAMLIGSAGAWCMAQALLPHQPHRLADLLLPAGAAIWICGATWRRRGHPMRRSRDWNDRS